MVFLLLLYSNPHDAASRFNERLLETLLGVGLAYTFGLGLPALAQRRRGRDRTADSNRRYGRSVSATPGRTQSAPRGPTCHPDRVM
jgi:hypothetical protein